MSEVRVRRVYDEVAESDGRRVLVDRLWPRGVRKSEAALDAHVPDVAPSTPLRRWYGHDPARAEEFRERYRAELAAPPAGEHLAALVKSAREGPLTLLTATRDLDRSHAAVLAERIREELARADGGAPA